MTDELNRREFFAAAGLTLAAAGMISGNATVSQMENDLSFLSKYPTSLIESAIYLLKGTHDGITLTLPGLRRQTKGSGTIAGYAVTSTFSTDPDDARGRIDNLAYWEYAFSRPGPKIAVAQDVSNVPGSGSSWGRQNAHIHKGLGCVGVLTNGGARDIEAFDAVGFSVFSGSLTAGHGNPHFISYGKPVEVVGATFGPDEIVCLDEHGAIVIPKEMLPHIAEAAEETLRRTNVVAEYAKRKDFTPKGLAEVTRSLRPATPWKPSAK